MTRTYSNFITAQSKQLLAQLADKSTDANSYRQTMALLGQQLGNIISERVEDKNAAAYLACTVEDADYLAQGIFSVLEQQVQTLSLACFWNERFSPYEIEGLKAAPIIRRYKEPSQKKVKYLIVVKSIVSGGCVVKTNLTDLIQTINPEVIFIASPVFYAGAEEKLASEFETAIHKKFQFVYFAQDDERTAEGEVLPGIGGVVYDRLGFDGQAGKNAYTPEIVRTRRSRIVAQVS